MSWGKLYWPSFLTVAFALFIIPECMALMGMNGTGVDNTLSNWIWTKLRIHSNEQMNQWSALDFLLFCQWLTLIVWLTWHFFFRKFT
jgi:hypothetical protein